MISKGNCWTSDIKTRLHVGLSVCLGVKTIKVSCDEESNTIGLANKVEKMESNFPIIINIGILGVQIGLPLLTSKEANKVSALKNQNTKEKSRQMKEKTNQRKLKAEETKQGEQTKMWGKIVGFRQELSSLDSSKPRVIGKHSWGDYYDSGINKKYSLGQLKAWSKKYNDGNSWMWLYGTEPFPIVGFHQECTDGGAAAERVIKLQWGLRTLGNGIIKKSIGSGRAWSPEHGWGHAYLFIFIHKNQDVIV